MTTSHGLRIVFAGTPLFAAKHLEVLIASEHSVVGVYTQPDRPAGRGKALKPSEVKQVALDADIPVFQPESLKPAEEQAALHSLNADVMVVVAYGLLLPLTILKTPRFGCINVHASLLPRWRGAAPIQRAIEAGDNETGITIMQMDEGLDTGDMLLACTCGIEPNDTAGTLHDRLAKLGPPALLDVLTQLSEGRADAHVQDHTQSTYAKKLLKVEAAINWQNSADTICKKIRAFNPFPVCFCKVDDTRIRIFEAQAIQLPNTAPTNTTPGTILNISTEGLDVACGDGAIRIQHLQLPGKKPMTIKAFYNGHTHLVGIGQTFA